MDDVLESIMSDDVGRAARWDVTSTVMVFLKLFWRADSWFRGVMGLGDPDTIAGAVHA